MFKVMGSNGYATPYVGVVKDGQNFIRFERKIENIHKENGYWLFRQEHEERAYRQGFKAPEFVLLAQLREGDSPDDVELRWVPGTRDRYCLPRQGTASEHIANILEEHIILGLGGLRNDRVPVYPHDTKGVLLEHRQGKQHAVTVNDRPCGGCRAMKKRCDRALPACALCLKRSIPCAYPANSRASTPMLKFGNDKEAPLLSGRRASTPFQTHTLDFSSTEPAASQQSVIHTGSGFPLITDSACLQLTLEPLQNGSLKPPPTDTDRLTPVDGFSSGLVAPTSLYDFGMDTNAVFLNQNSSSLALDESVRAASILRAFERQPPTHSPFQRSSMLLKNVPTTSLDMDLTLAEAPELAASYSSPEEAESYPGENHASQDGTLQAGQVPNRSIPSGDPQPSAHVGVPFVEQPAQNPQGQTSDEAHDSLNLSSKPMKLATAPNESRIGESSNEDVLNLELGIEFGDPSTSPATPMYQQQDDGDILMHNDYPLLPSPQSPPVNGEQIGRLNNSAPSSEWPDLTPPSDLPVPLDMAHPVFDGVLPCIDCGELEGHNYDCNIASIMATEEGTINNLELQQIAEAVEYFDPERLREHQVPSQTQELEDYTTKVEGMAEVIRNEDSYKNDVELHKLSDDALLVCWAFRTSSKIQAELVWLDGNMPYAL